MNELNLPFIFVESLTSNRTFPDIFWPGIKARDVQLRSNSMLLMPIVDLYVFTRKSMSSNIWSNSITRYILLLPMLCTGTWFSCSDIKIQSVINAKDACRYRPRLIDLSWVLVSENNFFGRALISYVNKRVGFIRSVSYFCISHTVSYRRPRYRRVYNTRINNDYCFTYRNTYDNSVCRHSFVYHIVYDSE